MIPLSFSFSYRCHRWIHVDNLLGDCMQWSCLFEKVRICVGLN